MSRLGNFLDVKTETDQDWAKDDDSETPSRLSLIFDTHTHTNTHTNSFTHSQTHTHTHTYKTTYTCTHTLTDYVPDVL